VDNNIVETVLREVTERLEGAEVREEQIVSTVKVKECIDSRTPLLLEAGTGTGKTLAYLVPLIVSDKRAVVSTATKQLSEQIINKDMPFLHDAVKESSSPNKSFKYALLKGRDNYFCWYKDAEVSKLDDGELDVGSKNKIAKEIAALKKWSDETSTGDRAEAPDIVSDKIWKQYSSNSVECIGKNMCPFAAECFAERAKDKARDADIVVTNHSVVAHDLVSESSSLGERDVIIFDELHEVDRYMTDAWGVTLSANILRDAAKSLKPVEDMAGLPADEFAVSLSLNKNADVLKEGLAAVDNGRMPTPTGQLASIISEVRVRSFEAVTKIADKLGDKNISETLKQNLVMVRKKLESVIEAIDLLSDENKTVVKWLSSPSTKEEHVKQLQAAPMYSGVKLQKILRDKNILMIGVSATIRVGGSFNIPKNVLGYQTNDIVETLAVDSPFNYRKQAMLYIPDNNFPSPVWKERDEHKEAVKAVSHQLVNAMNGRAVVLTTTTSGIREIGEYLQNKNPQLNIIMQGDAPNSQIVEEFKKDEHSVLVGTMGLWHGLDLPGKTASLLIIDKIPFKPSSDPILEARKEYVESMGRDSFTEVFVADASIMLTQGFGRLIRTKSDKGIVAILDNRLLTKNYGNVLIKSLPDVGIHTDRGKVAAAAERLSKILDG